MLILDGRWTLKPPRVLYFLRIENLIMRTKKKESLKFFRQVVSFLFIIAFLHHQMQLQEEQRKKPTSVDLYNAYVATEKVMLLFRQENKRSQLFMSIRTGCRSVDARNRENCLLNCWFISIYYLLHGDEQGREQLLLARLEKWPPVQTGMAPNRENTFLSKAKILGRRYL